VQSGDLRVVFRVTQDWFSGFQGEFLLTNTGRQTMAAWQLQFDFALQISSAWDAVVQRQGLRYTATPMIWNSGIAPGATVSFGFLGSPGNVLTPPQNIVATVPAAPPTPSPTPSPTPQATPLPTPTPPPRTGGPSLSGRKIVGYFPEWGIYQKNYHVSDIPATKLNVINYAFAKPLASGDIVLFDEWAAVQRPYPGDIGGQPLLGNFNQLRKLKAAHPHLITLISVGGWTLSGPFSDIALTSATRERFARSAVDFIRRYGFDGVDIDWEYPVGGGLGSNTTRPEDKQNYTLLLREVRRQLDDAARVDGRKYYLTIAAPAGPWNMANFELGPIAVLCDWINVMTYDFHGGWENQTNHHAPHFAPPGDVLSVDATVNSYLATGVPAEKLVVGVPFYGRGWQGVGPFSNGLRQPSSGGSPGTYPPDEEFEYRDILSRLATSPATYTRYWDATAKAPWVYAPAITGGLFITYEDRESLGLKTQMIRQRNLGGIMFWEISSDSKTPSQSLLEQISQDLLATP
jgi:chitinase